MRLTRLLRTNLAPHRGLVAWLVVFQTLQTTANLLLPAISARLIDEGVLVGDRDTIWRLGGVMVVVSLVQVGFAAAAMWFAAKLGTGFGRDVRRDLFRRVVTFSGREVSHFGAPSLTTRITNDIQQVQLLLVMVATMMIAAPLTMVIGTILAIREDAGLAMILLVAIPLEVIVLALIVARMVGSFQLMQGRIDRVNTVLREQITGIRVVRAFTREPEESRRFATANDELTAMSMRAVPPDGGHLPDRDADREPVERRRAVDRRQPHRRRLVRGRLVDRLPLLSDPDPGRRDVGDVHDLDDSARCGIGRSHRRGARHRHVGPTERQSRQCAAVARSGRIPGSGVPPPGCRTCRSGRRDVPGRPRRDDRHHRVDGLGQDDVDVARTRA